MARIAGVDIPKQKRGVIALTYIFGIGKSRAKEILEKAEKTVASTRGSCDDKGLLLNHYALFLVIV